jgi:hypothetical protein
VSASRASFCQTIGFCLVYGDWARRLTRTVVARRVGNTDVYDDAGNLVGEIPLSELKGPPDAPLAAKQLEWLEARMNSSTADYLWVGAHYPVWAIGNDGPTGIRATMRPLLERWGAQWFNGHQHDLEHIVEKGHDVNYVSTGAGKFCCYKDSNLDTVPQGSIKFAISGTGAVDWRGLKPVPFEILSGFTSYRIGPKSMKVVFHAHSALPLPKPVCLSPHTLGAPQPFSLSLSLFVSSYNHILRGSLARGRWHNFIHNRRHSSTGQIQASARTCCPPGADVQHKHLPGHRQATRSTSIARLPLQPASS